MILFSHQFDVFIDFYAKVRSLVQLLLSATLRMLVRSLSISSCMGFMGSWPDPPSISSSSNISLIVSQATQSGL